MSGFFLAGEGCIEREFQDWCSDHGNCVAGVCVCDAGTTSITDLFPREDRFCLPTRDVYILTIAVLVVSTFVCVACVYKAIKIRRTIADYYLIARQQGMHVNQGATSHMEEFTTPLLLCILIFFCGLSCAIAVVIRLMDMESVRIGQSVGPTVLWHASITCYYFAAVIYCKTWVRVAQAMLLKKLNESKKTSTDDGVENSEEEKEVTVINGMDEAKTQAVQTGMEKMVARLIPICVVFAPFVGLPLSAGLALDSNEGKEVCVFLFMLNNMIMLGLLSTVLFRAIYHFFKFVSAENMHLVTLIHIPVPDVFTSQRTRTYAHVVSDMSQLKMEAKQREEALNEFNQRKQRIIYRVLLPIAVVLLCSISGSLLSWCIVMFWLPARNYAMYVVMPTFILGLGIALIVVVMLNHGYIPIYKEKRLSQRGKGLEGLANAALRSKRNGPLEGGSSNGSSGRAQTRLQTAYPTSLEVRRQQVEQIAGDVETTEPDLILEGKRPSVELRVQEHSTTQALPSVMQ